MNEIPSERYREVEKKVDERISGVLGTSNWLFGHEPETAADIRPH